MFDVETPIEHIEWADGNTGKRHVIYCVMQYVCQSNSGLPRYLLFNESYSKVTQGGGVNLLHRTLYTTLGDLRFAPITNPDKAAHVLALS